MDCVQIIPELQRTSDHGCTIGLRAHWHRSPFLHYSDAVRAMVFSKQFRFSSRSA